MAELLKTISIVAVVNSGGEQPRQMIFTAVLMIYGIQQAAKTPTSKAIILVALLLASFTVVEDCLRMVMRRNDFPGFGFITCWSQPEFFLRIIRSSGLEFLLAISRVSNPFRAMNKIQTFITTMKSSGKMKLTINKSTAYSISKKNQHSPITIIVRLLRQPITGNDAIIVIYNQEHTNIAIFLFFVNIRPALCCKGNRMAQNRSNVMIDKFTADAGSDRKKAVLANSHTCTLNAKYPRKSLSKSNGMTAMARNRSPIAKFVINTFVVVWSFLYKHITAIRVTLPRIIISKMTSIKVRYVYRRPSGISCDTMFSGADFKDPPSCLVVELSVLFAAIEEFIKKLDRFILFHQLIRSLHCLKEK
eukprot:Seg819.3 transcript_id=Seg819.3/GoldUCD/mRNA.D3Y31 product="hypothetical protein" protein_id=Seg819.3/GoldUCD/D3Y31